MLLTATTTTTADNRIFVSHYVDDDVRPIHISYATGGKKVACAWTCVTRVHVYEWVSMSVGESISMGVGGHIRQCVWVFEKVSVRISYNSYQDSNHLHKIGTVVFPQCNPLLHWKVPGWYSFWHVFGCRRDCTGPRKTRNSKDHQLEHAEPLSSSGYYCWYI